MAVDTEQKRKSAATTGPPINAPVVIPNSGIDQADRQQIAYSYSGILAGGGPSFVVAWAARSNTLLDGSVINAI